MATSSDDGAGRDPDTFAAKTGGDARTSASQARNRPFEFEWQTESAGYEWVRAKTLVDKGPRWHEHDEDGQSYKRVNRDAEWVLIPKGFWPKAGFRPHNQRDTHPLQHHPGLFRAFAALSPLDREGILAFANQHGFLGFGELVFPLPHPPALLDRIPEAERAEVVEYLAGERDYQDVRFWQWSTEFPSDLDPVGRSFRMRSVLDLRPASRGESHETWACEIEEMSTAVRLWDLVAARDAAGLDALLQCHRVELQEARGRSTHRYEWRWYLKGINREPVRWEAGDLATLGLTPDQAAHVAADLNAQEEAESHRGYYIQRGKGEPQPGESFTVATDYVKDRATWKMYRQVHPSLVTDPATGRVVMRMHPADLLTAMWLQFAQAVTGNKQFRQCRECDTWFEVSVGDDARTARRLFCDDPCKSRDYRRRKDRAAELKAEGLTAAQVVEKLKAEGLETDPGTVKGWVGRKRRKH